MYYIPLLINRKDMVIIIAMSGIWHCCFLWVTLYLQLGLGYLAFTHLVEGIFSG